MLFRSKGMYQRYVSCVYVKKKQIHTLHTNNYTQPVCVRARGMCQRYVCEFAGDPRVCERVVCQILQKPRLPREE